MKELFLKALVRVLEDVDKVTPTMGHTRVKAITLRSGECYDREMKRRVVYATAQVETRVYANATEGEDDRSGKACAKAYPVIN